MSKENLLFFSGRSMKLLAASFFFCWAISLQRGQIWEEEAAWGKRIRSKGEFCTLVHKIGRSEEVERSSGRRRSSSMTIWTPIAFAFGVIMFMAFTFLYCYWRVRHVRTTRLSSVQVSAIIPEAPQQYQQLPVRLSLCLSDSSLSLLRCPLFFLPGLFLGFVPPWRSSCFGSELVDLWLWWWWWCRNSSWWESRKMCWMPFQRSKPTNSRSGSRKKTASESVWSFLGILHSSRLSLLSMQNCCVLLFFLAASGHSFFFLLVRQLQQKLLLRYFLVVRTSCLFCEQMSDLLSGVCGVRGASSIAHLRPHLPHFLRGFLAAETTHLSRLSHPLVTQTLLGSSSNSSISFSSCYSLLGFGQSTSSSASCHYYSILECCCELVFNLHQH